MSREKKIPQFIFVGSLNPVKITAVSRAIGGAWPHAKVEGFDIKSQVSDQPSSDAETKLGSKNRAIGALKLGLAKNKIVLNKDLDLSIFNHNLRPLISNQDADLPILNQDLESSANAQNADLPILNQDLESSANAQNADLPILNQDLESSANAQDADLFINTQDLQLDTNVMCLGVGLEGGVDLIDNQLHNVVWVSVIGSDGVTAQSSGARFALPKVVADHIAQGQEMGEVISRLSKIQEVRKKQGFIGVATNNFINRTEEYANIAKITIGLWWGSGWDNDENDE